MLEIFITFLLATTFSGMIYNCGLAVHYKMVKKDGVSTTFSMIFACMNGIVFFYTSYAALVLMTEKLTG